MKVGDVVIVTSTGRDKITGNPYNYKWFGVAISRNVGAKFASKWTATLLYDLARDKPRTIYHTDKLEVLPQDKWPDGVHALRTAAILLGKIDI